MPALLESRVSECPRRLPRTTIRGARIPTVGDCRVQMSVESAISRRGLRKISERSAAFRQATKRPAGGMAAALTRSRVRLEADTTERALDLSRSMCSEERADLTHCERDPFLWFLPREHAHFGVRREQITAARRDDGHDADGELATIPFDVAEETRDRRHGSRSSLPCVRCSKLNRR